MWTYEHVNRDDIIHYGVLGMKRGQRRARINEQKAGRARAKGYAAGASKYAAKAKKIKAKHMARGGKEGYDRVAKTKTGKLVAQSMLMGTYGALNYNKLRANNVSRGKSLAAGYLSGVANAATGGLASVIEPRVGNAGARAKKTASTLTKLKRTS